MSFLFSAFCRCQGPPLEEATVSSDVEEPAKVEGDSKLALRTTDEKQEEKVSPAATADIDKASDKSTAATGSGELTSVTEDAAAANKVKDETETKKADEPKPEEAPKEPAKEPEKKKLPPEPLTTLEDNNFNDRGTSGLDEQKTYKYMLGNDYPCVLTGWTHTRPYAYGFLRNKAGTAGAVVSGLDPGVPYLWKVYQVATLQTGENALTVNGEPRGKTNATASQEATAEGRTLANKAGKITFTFSRDANEVHLSGLAVGREEGKEGKVVKPKAKAKVKAKAKAKKGKYDELGRRIDKVEKKAKLEESSSDEDILDDLCPSSKKNADFEREIKKMKKKMREGWTPEQREEMDNPWLHTQISEPERDLKKNMFKSFYQEQYAKLKSKAGPDLKQYESSDPNGGGTVVNSNLTAEGGHRPMPRPKGVKPPKDFKKEVGRVSQKDLISKYGCKGPRMLVSVYGDLFDVSDRPDKYGSNGPYWYMTGKDITWGLVSGEDSEENMDKFFDLFKIQPPEAADKRLQGLMSWWAFYEKEYGKPVGKNMGYDKEWGLPPPPNTGENCSIM